jgi:hypothetical protein
MRRSLFVVLIGLPEFSQADRSRCDTDAAKFAGETAPASIVYGCIHLSR